jgi:hypothetical protein
MNHCSRDPELEGSMAGSPVDLRTAAVFTIDGFLAGIRGTVVSAAISHKDRLASSPAESTAQLLLDGDALEMVGW